MYVCILISLHSIGVVSDTIEEILDSSSHSCICKDEIVAITSNQFDFSLGAWVFRVNGIEFFTHWVWDQVISFTMDELEWTLDLLHGRSIVPVIRWYRCHNSSCKPANTVAYWIVDYFAHDGHRSYKNQSCWSVLACYMSGWTCSNGIPENNNVTASIILCVGEVLVCIQCQCTDLFCRWVSGLICSLSIFDFVRKDAIAWVLNHEYWRIHVLRICLHFGQF